MNFRKATYFFLYLLILSPILSYLTFGVLGWSPIDYYFQILTIPLGLAMTIFSRRGTSIPRYAIFALLWALYLFIWTFYNGEFERRGLLAIIFNNQSLAVFFIIIIVNNTQFSDRFISKSIRIIKITVLLTAVVSIIQVFDNNFLNAWPKWMQEQGNSFAEGDIYTHRRTSIFGFIERNALGLSFIPLASILTGYLLRNRSKAVFIFLLASAIAAFLSNTRYVMISFLLITLQILIFNKTRAVGILRYLVILAVMIMISIQLINYLGYDMQDWADQRLFKEGSLSETSRYRAIENFLYFFPKFIAFGNGNVMDQDVVAASLQSGSSHIHVGYLSHLIAYGVVGCFFLFSFWFLLLKKLYKNARLTSYWGSFIAFITFVWAFATFSQSSIFYYGLIFALVFDKYYRDRYNSNQLLNTKQATLVKFSFNHDS